MTDYDFSDTDAADAAHRDPAAAIEADDSPLQVLRTPEDARKLGIQFASSEGMPEDSPWRSLVVGAIEAPVDEADEVAQLHLHAPMQALVAWYENGCGGKVNWDSPSAIADCQKVARQYFRDRASADAWVMRLATEMLDPATRAERQK